MDSGFVDLRLNTEKNQGNDSFWPSFTDIMTVIVMIFLIAMVVLLMRNMDLVNELRATMAAEEKAEKLAIETGKEKETLTANLDIAQEQISMLQAQIRDEERRLIEKENRIQVLTEKQQQLKNENFSQLQQLTEGKLARQKLEFELEQKKTTLVSTQTENTKLSEQLSSAKDQLDLSTRAARQYQLTIDQQKTQLKAQQASLATSEKSIETYQKTTSEQLQLLDEQRAKLEAAKTNLVKYKKTINDQTALIDSQTASLNENKSQINQTQSELESQSNLIQSLQSQISEAQKLLQDKDLELANRQNLLDSNQQTLTQAQQTITEQSDSLKVLREKEQNLDNKYLVLVGEHDKLKTQYQKLIRPARSKEGRHVVEVRYYQKDGNRVIKWREGTEGPYSTVDRKSLELSLALLKQRKPNGLYVKIIIPENSGLSYNEAWKFTHEIHSSYDYYFAD